MQGTFILALVVTLFIIATVLEHIVPWIERMVRLRRTHKDYTHPADNSGDWSHVPDTRFAATTDLFSNHDDLR
jgi:hypothetical protein